MAVGANALKTGIVMALIDSAPFGDGGLDARGVGAEDDFGSAINVAVGNEAAWAELSFIAETVDRDNNARVLDPLWLGRVSLSDVWKG